MPFLPYLFLKAHTRIIDVTYRQLLAGESLSPHNPM
jgi:hypothetical protein